MTTSKSNQQAKRQYRTASQWREIIDAYEQCNLTQSEFCKQKGIAISNLHAWRRKLASNNTTVGDSFIELHPPTAQSVSNHWDVELELGEGRLLRIKVR